LLRVIVCGASGRMGSEVIRAVCREPDLELVGAVDPVQAGSDAGVVAGLKPLGVAIVEDIGSLLEQVRADVMVDFTTPQAAPGNARTAIAYGVRPVIGTTGMSEADQKEIEELCNRQRLGGVIAPNFAIGAVLMMRFAATAAKFFPAVEIIELHHEGKLDAPSGTALTTAELISRARETVDFDAASPKVEKLPGVRGGEFLKGIRIHSVRLPGLVAHQEVIFGGHGQTLTIRHDSISRASFMPGVILAIRRVVELDHLVYGLDRLIFG